MQGNVGLPEPGVLKLKLIHIIAAVVLVIICRADLEGKERENEDRKQYASTTKWRRHYWLGDGQGGRTSNSNAAD